MFCTIPWYTAAAALVLSLVVSRVGAASPEPVAPATGGYPSVLWSEACSVLTAPANWEKDDVLTLSLDIAAVVGTALLLDEPVHDYVIQNPSDQAMKAADQIAPFGAEYSFGVLAAFYAGGLVAENENAVGVAKDGLASSILAAGIITPSLKYAVGRSRPDADQGASGFIPSAEMNRSPPAMPRRPLLLDRSSRRTTNRPGYQSHPTAWPHWLVWPALNRMYIGLRT